MIGHVSQTIHSLLEKAVSCRASDIHIENTKDELKARFRIDGMLQKQEPLLGVPKAQIISKVKIMANLDIAEHRLPQDGRAFYRINDALLDLRISICPTLHGEKCTIRILDRQNLKVRLEDLGMENDELAVYQKMSAKKNGIILVTGPTGSGKTTTLYATLSTLNRREFNITTIEDPIEYELEGINQIQVNTKTGLSFAKGLRSILRQDPDIIMVGEIRDLETAKIAFQAALTGHLVFSTLHTNDAYSAITRLIDIGIERYLIDAAIIGVVAQRLARKCANGTYNGRTGVFEIMPGVSKQNIIRTLRDNGSLKVKNGSTTQEEIIRVIDLD